MTTEERSDKLLELMLRLVIAMETIATRPPSKLKSAPQHDYTEGGDEDADYTDLTPMPFGKYRGTLLGKLDKGYVQWLKQQDQVSNPRLAKWLKTI